MHVENTTYQYQSKIKFRIVDYKQYLIQYLKRQSFWDFKLSKRLYITYFDSYMQICSTLFSLTSCIFALHTPALRILVL